MGTPYWMAPEVILTGDPEAMMEYDGRESNLFVLYHNRSVNVLVTKNATKKVKLTIKQQHLGQVQAIAE